jgi:hypothetical protein
VLRTGAASGSDLEEVEQRSLADYDRVFGLAEDVA